VRTRPGHELPPVFPDLTLGKLRRVRFRDYVIRFALGAAISVVAAVVGKVIGVRFGGTLLAFPAILPASLTLIQEKEGTTGADRDAIGAILGAVGLVIFGMVGEATFGRLEPALALALATVGWLVTAFLLYSLLAFLRPGTCDRSKD
jgi:uncharacterized membrane protein (GlpM family)